MICISDGKPTDNWKEVLKEVKKNNAWFSNARIFCIAIGDDAELDVLGEISGSKEEKTFPSEKIKRLMDYIYPFEADWWFDILPNIEFEESYYSNTKKSVFPLSTDEIEKVYYDDEKDDFWN